MQTNDKSMQECFTSERMSLNTFRNISVFKIGSYGYCFTVSTVKEYSIYRLYIQTISVYNLEMQEFHPYFGGLKA